VYYIRLKDPSLRQRSWLAPSAFGRPDGEWLGRLPTAKYGGGDARHGLGHRGSAIVIGGVGMMNSQLMSVLERTREIGVLRAVGWASAACFGLILMESISVCLIGG